MWHWWLHSGMTTVKGLLSCSNETIGGTADGKLPLERYLLLSTGWVCMELVGMTYNRSNCAAHATKTTRANVLHWTWLCQNTSQAYKMGNYRRIWSRVVRDLCKILVNQRFNGNQDKTLYFKMRRNVKVKLKLNGRHLTLWNSLKLQRKTNYQINEISNFVLWSQPFVTLLKTAVPDFMRFNQDYDTQ